MEENPDTTVLDGEIIGIKFALATRQEICTASISDYSINHSSQLMNPFLGLPLEFGKCESCGTSEPGKCDGHFGYIELPIPIYHPSHVSELKRMLSLLCLKCLKMKKMKFPGKSSGVAERLLASCCEDAPEVSIREVKTADGAIYLELKAPSRSRLRDGFWNFLERYGFRYGDGFTRSLLPCEVMEIIKRIPLETRKKLLAKGYFPQNGYVLLYLPVPPNCLSVPDVSDGVKVMSSDPSMSMLKKILKQVEIIRSSRSGMPNFESHEVEANDLQSIVRQYLEVRGTSKAPNETGMRFGVSKDPGASSTKAWLEKMKTLFISKGSGFSSRSVITGDSYKRVNEIGIPFEIAQRITFEERVNMHNMKYLQDLVDNKLCLTYRDGSSTYSLREGSKGHTFLRPGQIVHRRIMDGDIVFVNRPPTTHKHSLQALSVYVHDDHTVKINPLICGPLGADFDGDSIHLFYPQSPAAKAEVLELFSVEKQLLSSHNGNLNLQLATDSLLSLKLMFKTYFLDRAAAQQLSMFVSSSLPEPAVLKASSSGPRWTASQMLQIALPARFDCHGDRYLINNSDILKVDFSRDVVQSVINEIVHSIFFEKGPVSVLKFFDSLQPLLMENLFSEGFSVSLEDFYISRAALEYIHQDIKVISPLLCSLRSTYNERAEMQLENHIRLAKVPVANFILKSSGLGDLIDSKSDSAVDKVVQQIGFLGLQLSDKGKFYSKTLVEEIASYFESKYSSDIVDYPSLKHGLVKSCFIHGLDPYEAMVHSISAREAIVRSSRGLAEPGTLFKNLMAILRDVVICYDGTVRNVCSNSVIQFNYGTKAGSKSQSLLPAGEPVGVLAATAISNPAYKAVLDSTPKSTSTWELMKEILLCRVNFKNDLTDRRVILYLNDCNCGRKYCQENAVMLIKNNLKKASLKDATVQFMIEYKQLQTEGFDVQAGLVGHVHLNKTMLKEWNISMQDILQKCQDKLNSFQKKKKVGHVFRRTVLSVSECCSFHQSSEEKSSDMPCLMFFWQDTSDIHLERTSDTLANLICPVLFDTIIKGDPRIFSVNIIWVGPEATSWIRDPSKTRKGELALDVVIEKQFVKESGDAWRVALNSCLPVLHLIDTTRSIPYAIKQVQELLGISCAFNQAVQRLSTSVTSVAKGILKEHLVLLASSMTCAGNLVGFTSGGYKALSRLLNIQVPFTEATLSTPKRCFEKAAEKCHMDTLHSIVASCAWGKHVALGTGTRFDIFLDKKVELIQEGKMDVYDFLQMVRSTNREEANSGCLGVELDDLELDEDNIDWNLSPEHDGFDNKPVFEDSGEVQNALSSWETEKAGKHGSSPTKAQIGSWDAAVSCSSKSENIDNSWNVGMNTGSAILNSWGTGKQDAFSTEAQEDHQRSDGWGVAASGWGSKSEKTTAKENESVAAGGGWGSKCKQPTARSTAWDSGKQDVVSARAQEENKRSSGWGAASDGWGSESEQTSAKSNVWEAGKHDLVPTKAQEENERSSDWGTAGGGWGSKSEQKTEKSNVWESRKQESAYPKSREENEKSYVWGTAGDGWRSEAVKPAPKLSVWDAKKQDSVSNKARDENERPDGWGTASASWGLKSVKPAVKSNVGDTGKKHLFSTKAQEQTERSDGWGAAAGGWDAAKQDSVSMKAQEESERSDGVGAVSGGWGAKPKTSTMKSNVWEAGKHDLVFHEAREQNEGSDGWGSGGGGWDTGKQGLVSSEAQEGNERSDGWKADGGGWGSKSETSTVKSDVWGAGKQDSVSTNGQEENDRSDGWGTAGGGWGSNSQEPRVKSNAWRKNAGDWKLKNNRPPKTPGMAKDDSTVPALYSATRQRLDIFTSEEQDILLNVEPLMRSIRRIMHNSVDGDPLSADDQSYVIANVFNHHPDKAAKMGAGIDYITVNKHSSFQDSRCFYVVSTDGLKQDFSYRKCLENFIKGKYPDLAEAFVGKYFARPRQGRKRERQETPDAENRQ